MDSRQCRQARTPRAHSEQTESAHKVHKDSCSAVNSVLTSPTCETLPSRVLDLFWPYYSHFQIHEINFGALVPGINKICLIKKASQNKRFSHSARRVLVLFPPPLPTPLWLASRSLLALTSGKMLTVSRPQHRKNKKVHRGVFHDDQPDLWHWWSSKRS